MGTEDIDDTPPRNMQVQQLCEKASAEVAEGQGVRIANFLCPGNYAISGGLDGCAVVEKIAKPDFKVQLVHWRLERTQRDSAQQHRSLELLGCNTTGCRSIGGRLLLPSTEQCPADC